MAAVLCTKPRCLEAFAEIERLRNIVDGLKEKEVLLLKIVKLQESSFTEQRQERIWLYRRKVGLEVR